MSFVVSPTSCVVLLLAGLHLAAVSCHLEQEEKEETGGWSVWEQGSGETDKSLELEPNLFPDEEEVNFCKPLCMQNNQLFIASSHLAMQTV